MTVVDLPVPKPCGITDCPNAINIWNVKGMTVSSSNGETFQIPLCEEHGALLAAVALSPTVRAGRPPRAVEVLVELPPEEPMPTDVLGSRWDTSGNVI